MTLSLVHSVSWERATREMRVLKPIDDSTDSACASTAGAAACFALPRVPHSAVGYAHSDLHGVHGLHGHGFCGLSPLVSPP